MRKSFVVLTFVLAAAALSGCVVAPAQPAYYGYAPAYDYGYAPGYYSAYPAYAEPSIGIGIGFGGGGGWHGDHGWHGGHRDHGWHGRH